MPWAPRQDDRKCGRILCPVPIGWRRYRLTVCGSTNWAIEPEEFFLACPADRPCCALEHRCAPVREFTPFLSGLCGSTLALLLHVPFRGREDGQEDQARADAPRCAVVDVVCGRLVVAYRETVAAVLSTNSVRHADLCVPEQTSSTTSPRSRATARAPPSSSFS